MQEMYIWDIGRRAGFIDFRGGQLEDQEFPYEANNEIIFDENGVVIRSFPAVRVIDGAHFVRMSSRFALLGSNSKG